MLSLIFFSVESVQNSLITPLKPGQSTIPPPGQQYMAIPYPHFMPIVPKSLLNKDPMNDPYITPKTKVATLNSRLPKNIQEFGSNPKNLVNPVKATTRSLEDGNKPDLEKVYKISKEAKQNKCKLKSNLKFPFHSFINEGTTIPRGQCVEWADGRYFSFTGKQANFNGNASSWVDEALKHSGEGWEVSDKPSFPSIIVIQPFVQQADEHGHVAVVESVNEDGSVCTSNWNFPQRGKLSLVVFKPGNGVKFIRHRDAKN